MSHPERLAATAAVLALTGGVMGFQVNLPLGHRGVGVEGLDSSLFFHP